MERIKIFMIEKVIKRDGKVVPFKSQRIVNAIQCAYREVYPEQVNLDIPVQDKINEIVNKIQNYDINTIDIEKIQDFVEEELMYLDKVVAKAYILYREKRNIERFKNSNLIQSVMKRNNATNVENANANVDERSFSGREKEASSDIQKIIALDYTLSEDVAMAHKEMLIYQHDLEKASLGVHNCLFADLGYLLKNGFKTRNGDVRTANSFSSACQLIAVIFQCQSQVQFGGVASTHIDNDLAPYVKASFKKHIKDNLFKQYRRNNSDPKLDDTNEDNSIYINQLKNNLFDKLSKLVGDIVIDNNTLKAIEPTVYKDAIYDLNIEGKQAAEGLYHNLNTLESRAGSQVPFTSINFGHDSSTEARLVTKWLLNASINGIGKLRKTSIFPISIFQYKHGISADKDDPNYDLKKLAIKSMSKRIYPNFVNCNWSEAHEDSDDPNTWMATMGCVEGNEVVIYKYKDRPVKTNSFKNLWNFMENLYSSNDQADLDRYRDMKKGKNFYIDVPSKTLLIYDSDKKDFVEVTRLIRNTSKKWLNITFTKGRVLTCTEDHMFETSNRGVVFAKNLLPTDTILINTSKGPINKENDYDDKKDFTTLRLRTSYNRILHEEESYMNILETAYDYRMIKLVALMKKYAVIKCKDNALIIKIKQKSKTLALQAMYLIQSLGMNAKCKYRKKDIGEIHARINVEFYPNKKCLQAYEELTGEDLKALYSHEADLNLTYGKSKLSGIKECCSVKQIIRIKKKEYSYDVTTASEHFEVSGIYSHNCRTLIGNDVNGYGYRRVGRGNNVPVTINLPKLGILYGTCTGKREKPDLKGFTKAFDETLKLAEKALLERFSIIAKQSAKAAPFMYENGTIYNGQSVLDKDTVYDVVKHNTLAIGYIGIHEMCMALFGESFVDNEDIYNFALSLVERINKFAKEAGERNGLNFGCYATPAEGCCHTLCRETKKQYGVIKGVTDREYFTNSHHVPVFKNVSIFDKLKIEAPFTKYPTAGCITYVELDSEFSNNLEAIEKIIDYAFDELDIPYLAFNFPIDTCLDCGYKGDIPANSTCPQCGSDKIERLRRVTGYLTTDYRNFNKGKIAETNDRIKHSLLTRFDEDLNKNS